MRHYTRALAVLLMTFALAAGCARAAREQQVSEAPPPASAVTEAAAAPIPGHPPVTTSGVVARFDPTTGILTFKDGRMVKLTDRSTVLQPVDTRTMRTGEQIIVRNALPVGVQSTSTMPGTGASATRGKRQRMATIAGVDEPNQLVWLTDGTAVRVTPATRMRMGAAGAPMILADLRPGDELVIVMADDRSPTAGAQPSANPAANPAANPSALPRETIAPPPGEASELMIFREPQAP